MRADRRQYRRKCSEFDRVWRKVDAIRNQHLYVSNYVSAKSGKMWHLEKKKKVQAALQ
jgi:hypothetical protein